jgi:hypothetical protein
MAKECSRRAILKKAMRLRAHTSVAVHPDVGQKMLPGLGLMVPKWHAKPAQLVGLGWQHTCAVHAG